MDKDLTHRYVEQAIADNGVIELRHQDGKVWTSGLFDNADDLLAAARHAHHIGNLFISLNRPSPRIAVNRMGSDPLGNDDMQWFTRLFFDFDPISVRRTVASTNSELACAKRAATRCTENLQGDGMAGSAYGDHPATVHICCTAPTCRTPPKSATCSA